MNPMTNIFDIFDMSNQYQGFSSGDSDQEFSDRTFSVVYQELPGFYPLLSPTNKATLTSSISLSGSFAIRFKCRVDNDSGSRILLGNTAATNPLVAVVNTFAIRFRMDDATTIVTPDNVLTQYQVHDVYIVRVGTGAVVTIYVDGVEVSTGNTFGSITLNSIGHYTNTALDLTGSVFDLQIWTDGDQDTGTPYMDLPMRTQLSNTQVDSVSANHATLTAGTDGHRWWSDSQYSFDVFVIAGQSNAQGGGDSASSPAITGIAYSYEGTAFTSAVDPVGGATDGSAWPAFANEWYSNTGRIPIFVETAVGGSALLAAAEDGNGDWSPTGTLYAASVADALEVINHSLFEAGQIASICVLWAQGEREGQSINGTTITGALYQSALESLAGNFETDIGTAKFLVSLLGATNDGSYISGFDEIRAAQQSACDSASRMDVMFSRARYFPDESKMADTLHYTQAGYNEIGAESAHQASMHILGFINNKLIGNLNPSGDDALTFTKLSGDPDGYVALTSDGDVYWQIPPNPVSDPVITLAVRRDDGAGGIADATIMINVSEAA